MCARSHGVSRTNLNRTSLYLSAKAISFVAPSASHNNFGARTSKDIELELKEGRHFVFGGDACDKVL